MSWLSRGLYSGFRVCSIDFVYTLVLKWLIFSFLSFESLGGLIRQVRRSLLQYMNFLAFGEYI